MSREADRGNDYIAHSIPWNQQYKANCSTLKECCDLMVGELDFRLSSGEHYDVFFGKTRFFYSTMPFSLLPISILKLILGNSMLGGNHAIDYLMHWKTHQIEIVSAFHVAYSSAGKDASRTGQDTRETNTDFFNHASCDYFWLNPAIPSETPPHWQCNWCLFVIRNSWCCLPTTF